MTRLLLILAFVLQPIWLNAGSLRTSMPAGCGDTACCEVVETTTCCGEHLVEHRCGKTGGECLCGVEPGEPQRTPRTPLLPGGLDTLPVFLAADAGAVIDLVEPARPAARRSTALVHRSHNETQALLCVWRT